MGEVSRAKVFARLIFIEIEQASGFFLMKKPPGGQLARVCELKKPFEALSGTEHLRFFSLVTFWFNSFEQRLSASL